MFWMAVSPPDPRTSFLTLGLSFGVWRNFRNNISSCGISSSFGLSSSSGPQGYWRDWDASQWCKKAIICLLQAVSSFSHRCSFSETWVSLQKEWVWTLEEWIGTPVVKQRRDVRREYEPTPNDSQNLTHKWLVNVVVFEVDWRVKAERDKCSCDESYEIAVVFGKSLKCGTTSFRDKFFLGRIKMYTRNGNGLFLFENAKGSSQRLYP